MIAGSLLLQEIIFEASEADNAVNLAKIPSFLAKYSFVLLIVERNGGILVEEHGRAEEEEGGQSQVNVAIRIQVVKQFLGVFQQLPVSFLLGQVHEVVE